MGPADRHIYLTLIDSAIMAQMASDAKYVEAQTLAGMIYEAQEKRDHALADIINKKHSKALHRASEYKGQYIAYQAIRKYMARMGYKFV